MDDLNRLQNASKQLEEMIENYKSIKTKFKENKLDELTEYEKQLSTRIGSVIMKEEFYDEIKNTKSTAKIVVKKNEMLRSKASEFGDYFLKKFGL
jgi:hypothetical protein